MSENSNKKIIESIGNLPKLSIIVIIISLTFHILYYKYFNFPIKYFISFSELSTAISEDLLLILPLWVIMVIVVLLANKWHEYLTNDDTIKQKKHFFNNPFVTRFLVVIFCLLIISLKLWVDTKYPFLELFFDILFGMSIFNLMATEDTFNSDSLMGKKNFIFLVLFVFVLSLRLWNNLDAVHKGKYNGTTIITQDTTYISSSSSFFIGKTDKFAFIYVAKDSGTIVVPIESIKKMFIKSK